MKIELEEPTINICKFCLQEKKSAKSLYAHQALCKSNPDAKNPADWTTNNNKGKPSWNAGLFGDDRLQHSDESKKIMSELALARSDEWHKENGKRVSETIKRKVEAGEWHTSLAKNMHIAYNGEDLHGTWELGFAKYCDENSILWERNKQSFPYSHEDKNRRYTPDFYLPEKDEYIEIKGFATLKDEAKWQQFPKDKKLRILMKKELQELKII